MKNAARKLRFPKIYSGEPVYADLSCIISHHHHFVQVRKMVLITQIIQIVSIYIGRRPLMRQCVSCGTPTTDPACFCGGATIEVPQVNFRPKNPWRKPGNDLPPMKDRPDPIEWR